MGISCFQLNMFQLNKQKSAATRQQMAISDMRDLKTGQLNQIIQNSENWYKDPQVKLLQAEEQNYDDQLKLLDTKIQAILANLEAQEKQMQENIKSEVPNLSL